MNRNIRLYPWFMAAANAYFWMPVFFLFLSERFSLREVLELEAIYYAAVVVMEVPSGYFSDRVGRRPTLFIGALAAIGSYVLFTVGETFAVFAAAQVALAMSIAFQSGTDASLHFDSLHAAGRDHEFADREANAARMASLASAGAALVGGVVAAFWLRSIYAVTLLSGIAQLMIVAAMTEPRHASGDDAATGFTRQLGRCATALRDRRLAWLFAFAVTAYALNHVPYHLAQPYTDLLLDTSDTDGRMRTSPLVLGLLTALIMYVRSVAAARSIAVRDRFGVRGVLLGSFALQVIIIAACGAILHPVVLVLLLFRSVPTGLQRAPLSAAVVPRLPRSLRATYLSVQSFAGRLVYSATLAGLAQVADPDAGMTWDAISRMGLFAAGGAAVVLVLLAATGRDG